MAERPRHQPTSRDVANAAGVSQSAVSLVFSGKWQGRVSESTAERIRHVARALGYLPNLTARSLRLERTGTVLLVVPTLANGFFAQLHTGAAIAAAGRDVSVVVCPLEDEDSRQQLPVMRQALDGLLLCSSGTSRPKEMWPDIPTVLIDGSPEGSGLVVNADVHGGMSRLAEHLIGLGHRHIGYLHATREAWTFSERLRAVQSLVRENGVQLSLELTPLDSASARKAAQNLLGRPRRPTALICEDDNVALAAYQAARALGLDVPADVSIAGFDDLPIARVLEPELTTVRIDAEALGRAAVTVLLDSMEGGGPASAPRIPATLQVRRSTAAPSAA